MCLLIATKENSRISNKSIKNAWSRNDDGAGYAFLDEQRKIQIRKFLDLKSFKKGYTEDFKKYGSTSKFLIHFRYATHGSNDENNVHPFRVSDDLVFGHNGVINAVRVDDKLSDTRVFNVDILRKLDENFLSNEGTRSLIGNYIGHSKLVFLDTKNEINIINEHLGHWNDKNTIWYSNDGYSTCKVQFKSTTGYGSYYRGGGWNFKTVYGTTNNTLKQTKSDDKKDKFRLAGDEFLECEFCGCQTDRVQTTETDYQVCESCFTTAEKYQI